MSQWQSMPPNTGLTVPLASPFSRGISCARYRPSVLTSFPGGEAGSRGTRGSRAACLTVDHTCALEAAAPSGRVCVQGLDTSSLCGWEGRVGPSQEDKAGTAAGHSWNSRGLEKEDRP